VLRILSFLTPKEKKFKLKMHDEFNMSHLWHLDVPHLSTSETIVHLLHEAVINTYNYMYKCFIYE
jgi:hypothetical protein